MFLKKKDNSHHLISILNGGPGIVEKYLDQLIQGITVQGQYARYAEGIAVLEREQLYPPVAFLLGYFHLQAGTHAGNQSAAEEHYEQAVSFFEKYARSQQKGGELKFFALWQAGSLRHLLQEPWPDVEETLLKAMEADPVRGEGVADILSYYVTSGKWRIAYLYSSYCMEQFHGKEPAARKWHVNAAFYGWQILDYHTHICLSLNKKEEAISTYNLLCKVYGLQPQSFTMEAIQRINAYKATIEAMSNKEPLLKAV